MGKREENSVGAGAPSAGKGNDTLLQLAARCESEEPSRELDVRIWLACERPPYRDKIKGCFEAVLTTGGKGGRPKFFGHCDGIDLVSLYTTSLDAAVTLVPEGDDVFWRSGHDGEGPDPSAFRADVLVVRLSAPANGFVARARTEPMARCAAALKARAALSKTEGR